MQHMHIPAGQTYKSPGEAYVEGDASSASYFLAGEAELSPPTDNTDGVVCPVICNSQSDGTLWVLSCCISSTQPQSPSRTALLYYTC